MIRSHPDYPPPLVKKKPAASASRPQRRGSHVVQRVLEATIDEVARVGFARLSVDGVSMRAGVNKTTVYRRWETKERLVYEALSLTVGDVLDLPDTGTVRTDLTAFLQRSARFLESTPGHALLRVLFAEGADPTVLRIAGTLLLNEGLAPPRAAIERAIARGELPPTTDARLVIFTMVGAIIHRVFVENARVSNSLVERIVDLVLYGATQSNAGSAAAADRGARNATSRPQ